MTRVFTIVRSEPLKKIELAPHQQDRLRIALNTFDALPPEVQQAFVQELKLRGTV